MSLDSNDEELFATIRGLSQSQLRSLADQYSTAYLEQFFQQMKETIALEAQKRIQA